MDLKYLVTFLVSSIIFKSTLLFLLEGGALKIFPVYDTTSYEVFWTLRV
jgi:hypothetical protein